MSARQEIVRQLPNGPLRISGPCPPGLADAIELVLRQTEETEPEVSSRTVTRGVVEVRCPHCRELHSHQVPTATDGLTAPRRGDCGGMYRIKVKAS